MRQITKDIQITIDGAPTGFRLTKPDAFSGITLLRLLMRLGHEPSASSASGGEGQSFRTRRTHSPYSREVYIS